MMHTFNKIRKTCSYNGMNAPGNEFKRAKMAFYRPESVNANVKGLIPSNTRTGKITYSLNAIVFAK